MSLRKVADTVYRSTELPAMVGAERPDVVVLGVAGGWPRFEIFRDDVKGEGRTMRVNAGRMVLLIGAVFITGEVALAQTSSPLGQPAKSRVQARPKPTPAAPTAAAVGEGEAVSQANNWTVGLATGVPEGGAFLRIGGEIARNLNDGDRLRVIPMITPGALQNIKDLLYLKGVDVALTNTDVLEHYKTVEKIPNIEKRIHYITELLVTDVHLLVRPEIGSLKDLEGKRVSFGIPGTGASITAPIVFRRLGIKVEPVYINNAAALEKMKTGELAGLVNPGGKPHDLFLKFKNDDYGFKFLAIPADMFDDVYVPRVLTDQDYPGYIKPGEKVETIGVQNVLAVYNWPMESDRFRRVERFIDYFFDRLDGFQKPPYHPDWKSINLAAKVPGWTRYWVAEEKLKQMAAGKPAAMPQTDVQLARQQPGKPAPQDAKEQERLFQEFLEWSKNKSRRNR